MHHFFVVYSFIGKKTVLEEICKHDVISAVISELITKYKNTFRKTDKISSISNKAYNKLFIYTSFSQDIFLELYL